MRPEGSSRGRRALPILVTAVLAGGAGFLLSSSPHGGRPPEPALASAPAQVAPAATVVSAATVRSATPEVSAPSLLELARSGDLGALKQLELRSAHDRTIEEALALAEGHATLAKRDALRLLADLERDPSLFEDRSTMAYTYRLALDVDAAPTLLAGLARLTHPTAADLLYDLATRGEPGARLVLLADDLLLGPAVRAEVSKPLAIALELRAVRSCPALRALLPRVTSDGDGRAAPLLERFRSRAGCGPKNKDDCFPCLRDEPASGAFEAAAKAVSERGFRAPWALRDQRAK